MGRNKTLKRLRRKALDTGVDFARRPVVLEPDRGATSIERFTTRGNYRQLKRQGRRRP